ncbi:Protein TIC 20-v [Durusdinium trenchii]|uniref:Chloroplastic (Translocon at the inner envelope membrane of chloroplasts 20-V) (AtTIC20-v) n=1 Tax=Durusdinium trenchii TaxID=1381693 RepID=A0ABP0HJV7_9DINO
MRAKERERQEQEELERQKQEFLASLPERNEDDSLPTRLIAACAYMLPLLDAAERFGWPLALMNPTMATFMQALNAPMALLSAVPFGLGFLLVFIGMQFVANNPENPALVRYNMRQAVQLDIMLFFPIIIGQLGHFALAWSQMELPGLTVLSSTAVFFAMLACCVYSVGCCLAGAFPKGVPFVSEVAELTLRDTRPKESDSTDSKDSK